MSAAIMTLLTFAASWPVLYVGHQVADYLTGQTDWQANNKAAPSRDEVAAGVSPRRGWGACLAHVTRYHATLVVIAGLAWLVLPLAWTPAGVIAALLWSAATHAVIDRRWPVVWLLEHIGSAEFARLNSGGMNGVHLVDQALHSLALGIAAAMLAVI